MTAAMVLLLGIVLLFSFSGLRVVHAAEQPAKRRAGWWWRTRLRIHQARRPKIDRGCRKCDHRWWQHNDPRLTVEKARCASCTCGGRYRRRWR